MASTAMKKSEEEIHHRIHELAQEVLSEITELDPTYAKELLGSFMSELVLSVADRERRDMLRQKQSEGISAARARVTRLGRPAKPLPQNFHEVRRDWRDGKFVLKEAAAACGMPESTFYMKAMEFERESCRSHGDANCDVKKIRAAEPGK